MLTKQVNANQLANITYMFWKKKSFYIVLIIIAVVVVGFFMSRGEKAPEYITAEAKSGELIQEVSITGSVKAAEEVDLALERSGKVSLLSVKVGDVVKKGQLLLQLSSGDLSAQLQQTRANVESAQANLQTYEAALATQQAKLDEYKKGTRPEELQIAQTSVTNATNNLADAENNYDNTEAKAQIDLDQDYTAALNDAAYAVTVAENAILTLTDFKTDYFDDGSSADYAINSAKASAVQSLLGAANAGTWSKNALSQLNGGAKGDTLAAQLDPTETKIETALRNVKDALQKVKIALSAVPVTNSISATDITLLNTQRNYIDTEITSVNSYEQSILVQKATNESTLLTAELAVNTASNALDTAKDTLKLKQAGYTTEQIAAQQAQVQQAEANVASQRASIKSAQAGVNNVGALLGKNTLRSPIEGTVTSVEAKVGEIAPMNAPMITVMSEAEYQIEANVPEVDIANIKIDDVAHVTLDAYGNDVEFEAKVINIDPAETLIDNVPTYKITFQFTQEDEMIRSGMTANIDIMTDKRDNVVSIPQRAVLKKDGDKVVRVLDEDGINFKEVKVTTGLRGSDGNIEILEGINDGDTVILSIKNEK